MKNIDDLQRRTYENWSQMISVEGVLTATPTTDEEAIGIVRWAAEHGYRVRPIGAFHTWSPLAFEDATNVIAIDQSQMTGLLDFVYAPVPAATFRAGTTLAQALEALENIDNRGASDAPGWSWPDFPGVPDVTLGGMLAIVSDGSAYVIREYRRDEPEAAALLVHLGAAYLLSVTMRVVPNCFVGRRVEYPNWQVAYGPTAQAGSISPRSPMSRAHASPSRCRTCRGSPRSSSGRCWPRCATSPHRIRNGTAPRARCCCTCSTTPCGS